MSYKITLIYQDNIYELRPYFSSFSKLDSENPEFLKELELGNIITANSFFLMPMFQYNKRARCELKISLPLIIGADKFMNFSMDSESIDAKRNNLIIEKCEHPYINKLLYFFSVPISGSTALKIPYEIKKLRVIDELSIGKNRCLIPYKGIYLLNSSTSLEKCFTYFGKNAAIVAFIKPIDNKEYLLVFRTKEEFEAIKTWLDGLNFNSSLSNCEWYVAKDLPVLINRIVLAWHQISPEEFHLPTFITVNSQNRRFEEVASEISYSDSDHTRMSI